MLFTSLFNGGGEYFPSLPVDVPERPRPGGTISESSAEGAGGAPFFFRPGEEAAVVPPRPGEEVVVSSPRLWPEKAFTNAAPVVRERVSDMFTEGPPRCSSRTVLSLLGVVLGSYIVYYETRT